MVPYWVVVNLFLPYLLQTPFKGVLVQFPVWPLGGTHPVDQEWVTLGRRRTWGKELREQEWDSRADAPMGLGGAYSTEM